MDFVRMAVSVLIVAGLEFAFSRTLHADADALRQPAAGSDRQQVERGRYLGPGGEPAPAYVPPDQEPATPYALFPPAAPQ